MRTADQWFAEYGESQRNHTNEMIHWVCVPIIFGCILGFISQLPVPPAWHVAAPWFDWTMVAIAAASAFYLRLSPALSAGLLCFMSICYLFIILLDLYSPWPVGRFYAAAFGLAWVGQFIGHRIEGRKPAFFRDVLFLLIGPAWLMSLVYRKVGQRY